MPARRATPSRQPHDGPVRRKSEEHVPQKEMLTEQGDDSQQATIKVPQSTLGVGIIGVNPAWGWAATAHIPALRALPNYEVRALSASSPEAARAAGEAFGVAAVFSDHEQLVA